MAMTLKSKPNHPNESVQKSQVWSNVKVFFDCNAVVHHEFLPQGRTVNKEIMRRLSEAIHQKRTESWRNQSWILHNDKAPAHILMLVTKFTAKNKTIIMP